MIRRCALFSALLLMTCEAPAHDPETGTASAIRNEGVMVEVGDTKILFDPIYDNDFDTYQEIPETLASALTVGAAPYDGIDAVFVTHAHGDHFSATGLNAMLAAQPALLLYAPGQAIDMMREAEGWSEDFKGRTRPIVLEFGLVEAYGLEDMEVQAFSIPHAGWPQNHQSLQHYVYRVSFAGGARVMHLGDAAHDAVHYEPHDEALANGKTGIAFVPFWMLLDPAARSTIDDHLNASHVVGIHVPADVPAVLRESGEDFFSVLGETRDIPAQHEH